MIETKDFKEGDVPEFSDRTSCRLYTGNHRLDIVYCSEDQEVCISGSVKERGLTQLISHLTAIRDNTL